MKLEVELISEEIIRPSSPTPNELRTYQLSFLDQVTPILYNCMVMFYPEVCHTEANKIITSDQLKQSVSDALTYFYPLAGRLSSDEGIVDCNDCGIPFLETRVKCQLSDVLENPVPSELNKLLPFDKLEAETSPVGIQFNIFECGGIGVSACINHKIGDALSFFTFVNTWAAIARGDRKVIAPDFGSALLFPPRDPSKFTRMGNPISEEKVITKIFIFAASKIEEIRRKYTSLDNQNRPTRVEALSAFIYSRFMAATNLRSKSDTLSTVTHMVNLRTRIDPPLPEYSFGNLSTFTMTVATMEDVEENCQNLVSHMRDSIKGINKDYVKKVQDGSNPLDQVREITASYGKNEMINLSFTSLCRFPVYEADFGWGKPVWACSANRGMKNVVSFFDAVDGKGIEAWICLTEKDMAKLDSDEELIAFIAPKIL